LNVDPTKLLRMGVPAVSAGPGHGLSSEIVLPTTPPGAQVPVVNGYAGSDTLALRLYVYGAYEMPPALVYGHHVNWRL
jgi:hypothetical protein